MLFGGGKFDLESFVIRMVVIIFSISLHEFGHAISADRLGDPTPRRDGRITLMPDKHFDPVGFLMIVFTSLAGRGFGWGKPVMVDSRYFKHPRRDMRTVAAAGPFMNLLIALVTAGIIRILDKTHGGVGMFIGGETLSAKFAWVFLESNLALMFFNLIPIHPLDGGKILSSFLPLDQARQFDRAMWQYGPMILIISCWLIPGSLGTIIGPPIDQSIRFLIGQP